MVADMQYIECLFTPKFKCWNLILNVMVSGGDDFRR